MFYTVFRGSLHTLSVYENGAITVHRVGNRQPSPPSRNNDGIIIIRNPKLSLSRSYTHRRCTSSKYQLHLRTWVVSK